MSHIAFDIGGTSVRVAVAKEDGLGEVKKQQTPQSPQEAVALIASLARELCGEEKIDAAAGCIRGRVVDGVFLKDKGLPEWEGFELVKELSNALGSSVSVSHDASLAALGEARYGAGAGSDICVFVTVSTGVGGGRVVAGEMDRTTYNPEIGRQLINGQELEDLVSGSAVHKKFGIHPRELDSEEERNNLADILAIGLYNTTLHWSPETIVLGGSMILGVNPIPLERVEKSFVSRVTMYPKAPSLRMAKLGDNAGLEGARALLFRGK